MDPGDIKRGVAQFLFVFVTAAIFWRATVPRVPRPYNRISAHIVKDDVVHHAQYEMNKKSSMMVTLGLHDKIVLVMVGLPARGKSFITHKIIRYLKWLGLKAKNFNAGDKRRLKGHAKEDASFFDPHNESSRQLREELAMETLTGEGNAAAPITLHSCSE